MVDGALVIKSSADIVLTDTYKSILVSIEEWFQLSAPSHWGLRIPFLYVKCYIVCTIIQCGAVKTQSVFKKNIHKRHRRDMGCLLWIQHLFDILLEFLQSFMQYLTILDRVITALDCISCSHVNMSSSDYFRRQWMWFVTLPEWSYLQ